MQESRWETNKFCRQGHRRKRQDNLKLEAMQKIKGATNKKYKNFSYPKASLIFNLEF